MIGTNWLAPLADTTLVRRTADAAFVRAARYRTRQLDRLNPVEVQQHTLFQLIRHAQNTRFGRDHDFSFLRTLEDYQRRVPVRDYSDFWEQYWKTAYPRLDNITWPGHTPYYALSSGTTSGTTKYIPVTREMVASNRKAASTTLALFRNAHPQASSFNGRFFFLGGCTEMRPQADGSFAGDLSGIAAKEVAGVARPYLYPPLEISLIPDWNTKLQKLAEDSVRQRITAVSGVPSWMLKLFDSLLQSTGKSTLAEIWPDLRLIIHGGTKFDSYRETFRSVIGSDRVKYCEVYPCSEGFIATEDPRYQLLRIVPDHNIFFEFIPIAEFQDGVLKTPHPVRHTLANVELGQVYAVALTTCAGLWSYLIGDTVRFESRNPPLIHFAGRIKNFLSAFGEHLIEEEVEKAIAVAAATCGVRSKDHHVGPVFPSDPKKPGHHLYLIEFHDDVPSDLDRFVSILDAELCRLNEDYEAHRRDDLTMLAPKIWVVPAGGFDSWMASRGKAGGQNKVPRMDNSGKMTADLQKWFEANAGR
jgi:hypothetical protein